MILENQSLIINNLVKSTVFYLCVKDTQRVRQYCIQVQEDNGIVSGDEGNALGYYIHLTFCRVNQLIFSLQDLDE